MAANYITPPASFPLDVALEVFEALKSGDVSDNRIPAGALTLAAYGTKVTVGWPGAANEPERMDHVSEEDYRKVEELRDLVDEKASEAPAVGAPAGTEAFKFGDGTLIKLLGPLVIAALNAWLAGRTG